MHFSFVPGVALLERLHCTVSRLTKTPTEIRLHVQTLTNNQHTDNVQT